MRVLVTGGLGFIGSNFIRWLLERHNQVELVNVDALSYGSNALNLEDLESDGRYRLVKGDIAEESLVDALVKRADYVVNFAAETHVDRSISTPRSFLKSNVIGAFNILEALRKVNPEARMVQISTDEVYGDILEGSSTEENSLMPSSPYSASKASADVFALAYARTYGLKVMVTRCTNNYGPYQSPEKLIPKSIIRALKSLKIPLYGRGENVRDWIYVLDHCAAVERVMMGGLPGEVYNISSDEKRTNAEVVGEILKILGRDRDLLEFVEDRPGHDLRYSLDSSKIREQLGWAPQHSFEEGLRSTVRWYMDNQRWWSSSVDDRMLHPTPWKLEW